MHATRPPTGVVVARPEGNSDRAHRRDDEVTPAGATAAEQKPPARSVADPGQVVTAIADALRTLRGRTVTSTVSRVLAELVQIEVPWVSMDDLGDMLANPLMRGAVLDEEMIQERARNIAVIALHGSGR